MYEREVWPPCIFIRSDIEAILHHCVVREEMRRLLKDESLELCLGEGSRM